MLHTKTIIFFFLLIHTTSLLSVIHNILFGMGCRYKMHFIKLKHKHDRDKEQLIILVTVVIYILLTEYPYTRI